MPKITALPTDTAPDGADLIPFVDVTASRTEAVTVANLAASAAFTESPTFTGTPAAPTAATATNTTQVATTAYVKANRAEQAAADAGQYVAGEVSESEPVNPSTNMVWLQPQLTYDVENEIAWTQLFFASRISGTDGGALTQWNNLASSAHAVQADVAKRPTLRKQVASLNNRPAVEFTRANANHMVTSTFASDAQPNTIVLVGNTLTTTGAYYFVDGATGARHFFRRSVSNWVMGTSSTFSTSGGANNDPHLFVASFDGGTSSLEVDGVQVSSGTAGANAITRFVLGASYLLAEHMDGHIAFLGMLDGALTSGEKADLLAWVQSYYGTPTP